MRNFKRLLLCGATSICTIVTILAVVSTPALGEVYYGPLTFDNVDIGTQGGPYVAAGPQNGTTDISFAGDTLNLAPTEPGHALLHDTGFTTKLSSYTVTSTAQWSVVSSQRYSLAAYAIPGSGGIACAAMNGKYTLGLFDETDPKAEGGGRIEEWTSGDGSSQPFFGAADQTSGDGASGLDFALPYTQTMGIADTGDNATSIFRNIWEQEVGEFVNTWVVDATLADIRSYAVDEDPEYATHVGDLFDSLVSTARSSEGDTGFGYYVFSFGGSCDWDNTTVSTGPVITPLAGDANYDGVVNDADAAVLAANWQGVGKGWAQGDFNGDGNVNDIDATILAANWQTSPAETAAVPEPASVVLLLIGLLSLTCCRYGRSK